MEARVGCRMFMDRNDSPKSVFSSLPCPVGGVFPPPRAQNRRLIPIGVPPNRVLQIGTFRGSRPFGTRHIPGWGASVREFSDRGVFPVQVLPNREGLPIGAHSGRGLPIQIQCAADRTYPCPANNPLGQGRFPPRPYLRDLFSGLGTLRSKSAFGIHRGGIPGGLARGGLAAPFRGNGRSNLPGINFGSLARGGSPGRSAV